MKVKIHVKKELREQIYKTFKEDSKKIYKLIRSLEENPNKGKKLGIVAGISIREIKYKTFRIYFLLEKNELYLFNKKEIQELLIKFIEMSKKNDQEKTIEEIKLLLKYIKFEDI